MARQLQISDFFGAYPYIEDPLFNRKIAEKEEFAELQPDISEPTPERGGAFKHQKLSVRFLQWYDRLLMVHEPGTGKSCIIVHSAELFKKEYFKDPDDPTRINQAIILVRGPTLEANIRNEIVYRCTDRIYETDAVLRAQDAKARQNAITRELKVWYNIMTYTTFANKIREFQREEDLVEYMSNKAIYVDEAHNIPTLSDDNKLRKGRKQPSLDINTPNESVYETIFRAFHKGYRNKIILATATPMINFPTDIILRMNLLLPIDSYPGQMPYWSKESDSNPPSRKDDDILNVELEDIEPYFRGRISYVRAAETGAIAEFVGIRPSNHMTYIYSCYMSQFQYMAYLKSERRMGAQETRRIGDSGGEFYQKQKHASNFVFPDGNYGMSAFEKYIERLSDGRYQIQNTPDGHRLRQFLRSEEGLNRLSNKYLQITKLCIESYPDTLNVTDDNKGIIFIYFPDFVHGSGAIMLAQCLKENGYEEFRDTQNIFLASQNPSTNLEGRLQSRESRIARTKRYAILTSETSRPLIQNILDTLNSHENRYGHYIQVLIGARRTREGININNAVKMIMASSGWNPSNNVQAMDRVFRALSHETRIQEKRERIQNQQEQLTQERDEIRLRIERERENIVSTGTIESTITGNISEELRRLEERLHIIEQDLIGNVTLKVKVYNMASVYGGVPEITMDYIQQYIQYNIQQGISLPTSDPNQLMQLFRTDNYDTVDALFYILAENKDQQIRRIMRFIKQSAYDCRINYRRNVRDTDIPGSPDCDFAECRYQCTGMGNPPVILGEDRTTKILYYSEPEVEKAAKSIRDIFSKFYSLSIGQIHQLITNIDDIYIDMAIESIIAENAKLLDRMGFFGYLREGPNGVIYLERDPFEIRAHPENTAYTSVIIGTQNPNNNTFNDYIFGLSTETELNRENPSSLWNQLIQVPVNSDEFTELLNSFSLISKIKFLENALFERQSTGETNEFNNAIISEFNHTIYYMIEPAEALRKTAISIKQRGTGRGRKANPNKRPTLKDLHIAEDFPIPKYDPTQPGELIIIHTLLNQLAHDRTSYNAVNRLLKSSGQLRLLKMSEGVGWRDVNEYERIVYNNVIERSFSEIKNYYEQFPVYGIMIPPENRLRIRDREKEDPGLTDARSTLTGRVCTFWSKLELIDLLYRLNQTLPFNIPPTITRENMMQYLQSQNIGTLSEPVSGYSDDKLRHYYVWLSSNYSREDMCDIVREYLERTNRIFTGRRPQVSETPIQKIGTIQTGAPLTVPDYSQGEAIVTMLETEEDGEEEDEEEDEENRYEIVISTPVNTFGPNRLLG